MGKDIEVVVLDDEQAVARKAIDLILESASSCVALAGGETPRLTYELLGKAGKDLRSLEVFLTDERCVPWDHVDSNFGMLQESFLSLTGAISHPIAVDLTAEDAALKYEQELEPRLPFDLVLLGLGSDGHTASLFPGADRSMWDERLVVPTVSPDGMKRVSLTPLAINSSREAIFLVTGGSKRQALARLLRGEPIPASLIHPAGRLIALVDRKAAPG